MYKIVCVIWRLEKSNFYFESPIFEINERPCSPIFKEKEQRLTRVFSDENLIESMGKQPIINVVPTLKLKELINNRLLSSSASSKMLPKFKGLMSPKTPPKLYGQNNDFLLGRFSQTPSKTMRFATDEKSLKKTIQHRKKLERDLMHLKYGTFNIKKLCKTSFLFRTL